MQFNLKFKDAGPDAEISRYLAEQVNLTQYIRQLVLADMKNVSYTDSLIRRVREELLHSSEIEMKLDEVQHKYDSLMEHLEKLKEELADGKIG